MLLTGRLLMCTFLPGGEWPFFLVGGVGIGVVGSVATFIHTSQYNVHQTPTCIDRDSNPPALP